MTYTQSLRRIAAGFLASLLVGALAAPAHAQRTSLTDLLQRIQVLEGKMGNLIAVPCAPGQAITGVEPDGTPVCGRFVPATVTFNYAFQQGTPAVAEACPAWQAFITDASGGGFGSLKVSGSLGAVRTCSDPAKVAQILAALLDASSGPTNPGNIAVIECGGFNWSISDFCASTAFGAPGAPQAELKVSPVADPVPGACACQVAGENIYVVRPCIGNQNWGGVGTDVCNAPSQTMEVIAE